MRLVVSNACALAAAARFVFWPTHAPTLALLILRSFVRKISNCGFYVEDFFDDARPRTMESTPSDTNADAFIVSAWDTPQNVHLL
jgi:hypothetical protein